jgi:mRNA-degrading endonuclease RelE of RelBE toxin-antitoxin system
VARVEFTDEAATQFRALPRSEQREFDETFGWLERTPLRLPPWIEAKQLGEQRGQSVFRVRVGRFRGIYCFDGEVVTFPRFRDRPNIKYGAQPKF